MKYYFYVSEEVTDLQFPHRGIKPPTEFDMKRKEPTIGFIVVNW